MACFSAGADIPAIVASLLFCVPAVLRPCCTCVSTIYYWLHTCYCSRTYLLLLASLSLMASLLFLGSLLHVLFLVSMLLLATVMLSAFLLLLAPFYSVAGLIVVGFDYTVDAFHLLLSHFYIDSSSPIFESVPALFGPCDCSCPYI